MGGKSQAGGMWDAWQSQSPQQGSGGQWGEPLNQQQAAAPSYRTGRGGGGGMYGSIYANPAPVQEWNITPTQPQAVPPTEYKNEGNYTSAVPAPEPTAAPTQPPPTPAPPQHGGGFMAPPSTNPKYAHMDGGGLYARQPGLQSGGY